MVSARLITALLMVTHRCHRPRPFRARRRNRPWPPGVQKVLGRLAAAVAGRGAEDVLHAARAITSSWSRASRCSGSGRDRLGHRRPALGRRDARLHGQHHRLERTRSDRPRRRARRHERRRQDGQADGVRRRPGPGAVAEGARPRRARRRAAERLADARHQRRPAHGHEGARHRPVRAAGRRPSRKTRTASTGRSTTGCTRPGRPTSSCG